MSCAALALTLSLTSFHTNTGMVKENQINPGIGVICDKFEGGEYRNSIGRISRYIGWRGNWVMVGIVSGYQQTIFTPYIAAYYDWGPVEIIGTPLDTKDVYGDHIGILLAVRLKLDIKKGR